jgi:membrane protease YdiL (CAAX protease family)
MNRTNERIHTSLGSIALHLAPGLVIAAFVFLMAWAALVPGAPSMFWLEIGTLVIGTPIMLLIMKRGAAREGTAGIAGVVTWRARLRWWEYLLWPALMLAFAGGVLTTLGKVINTVIQQALFGWLPPGWDIADYLLHPEGYARGWIIATWALGILTTTIWFPFLEEIYFRGYLLPRLRGASALVPIAGAVLFACYHLWTPWMIPVRIIALIPFIGIVWWKKDVKLGIIAHVALNIVGDTISAIPIVFG